MSLQTNGGGNWTSTQFSLSASLADGILAVELATNSSDNYGGINIYYGY